MGRVTPVLVGGLGAVCIAAWSLAASGATADEVPARPSRGCRETHIETGRPLRRSLEVDGIRRDFLLDVPDSIQLGQAVPLVFDFHGFQHSAAGVWKVSKFRDLASAERFITVYPDGLPVFLLNRQGAGWEIMSATGNRDVAFVTHLLDALEGEFCIDRARVFATGFSNGAFFSHLLGCVMPERFAAIAPVSGGRITVPCAPARGVPVLLQHGRNDELVPVAQARSARDAWVEIDRCATNGRDGCEFHRQCRDEATVEYCEDDGGHHWPEAATARIWRFFRQHPLRPVVLP